MDSTKLCACGCGKPAPIGKRLGEPFKWVKGHASRKPLKYLVEDCGYETPCYVWQGARTVAGYPTVTRDGKKHYVHRLVLASFVGPLASKIEACHRCDNPPCIRPDHLFAGTHADNLRDMNRKGRDYRGEPRYGPTGPKPSLQGSRHHQAKIDEETALLIRSRIATGDITRKALAAELGLSKSLVEHVARRKTWRHI